MARLLAAVLGSALMAAFIHRTGTVDAGSAPRQPVVVELFTSEGCSSCPPADALLIQLERQQPVPGAHIFVLSHHVDYWNYIGWKDPFSSAQFSQRQKDYAEAFGGSSIYTPQMIVDGQAEFIGSDGPRAYTAIATAAKKPKASMTLTAVPGAESRSPRFRIEVGELPAGVQPRDVEAFLAITESGLSVDVGRGENRGRKLNHTGVTRILKELGRVDPASGSLETAVSLRNEWKRADLTVIVFLQDRSTKRIIGAASIKVGS